MALNEEFSENERPFSHPARLIGDRPRHGCNQNDAASIAELGHLSTSCLCRE